METSDSSTPSASMARRARPSSSTGCSACSLATKTLTTACPPFLSWRGAPRLFPRRPLRPGLVVAAVGFHDVLDDAVTDHVPRGQVHERQPVDPGEDLAH